MLNNQNDTLTVFSETYKGWNIVILSEESQHFAVLEYEDPESEGQIKIDRPFKSAKSAQSFAQHYIKKANLSVSITGLVDQLMSGQLKTQNRGKVYVQFLDRLRQLEEMNWDEQE